MLSPSIDTKLQVQWGRLAVMASHPVEQEEGGGAWWESMENLVTVRDHALLNGLLLRSSSDDADDSCVQVTFALLPSCTRLHCSLVFVHTSPHQVAFTLTPSVFPVELFQLAQAVQRDLNAMVDAVSCDHEFIAQTLGR